MGKCGPTSSDKVYRPRHPRASPLWQCLSRHFYEFLQAYDQYEPAYGYLRPVVEDVVNKFIECGDLTKGFATARCGTCGEQYILAFSCKARYLCPSCHQKKVLLFGEFIMSQVLFPVPHRQYVFTIPKMLRIYFRNNRALLGKLACLARNCTREFLQTLMGLPDGKVGMVVSIQSFGTFLKNFHPHLHTLTADGLFRDSGTFHVMPRDTDVKPLEELFRVRVIKMLFDEELLNEDRADMLLSWRNSGFSVHAGEPIGPDQSLSLERTARYIIRNTFSLEKMRCDEEADQVIYQCDKVHPQTKRDYEVFTIGEFIAAITQHIPDRSAAMVRYYGWYSNRSRGCRRIQEEGIESPPDGIEVIDVSDYSPQTVPTKKWRELIAKVWEIDPLRCQRCGGLMHIRALTDDPFEVKEILKSLDLYDDLIEQDAPARSPPNSRGFDLSLDLSESQIPLDEIHLN